MKIVRSVKCTTKFATKSKQDKLCKLLLDYSNIVNFYIDKFWKLDKLYTKNDILKPIIDLSKHFDFSFRLRKVAAREAIDMILAVRERWKGEPKKISKPLHRGDRLFCSSTVAELNQSETTFDCFLKIRSVGQKIKLDIPIKKHKQFNKWESKGKRLNSYIITKNYVQFCFEINTGPKKETGKTVGVDTGIKCLATTNDGQKIGDKIEEIINTIKRCQHGSKRQKRLRNYLRHYINTCAKEIFKNNKNLQRIVVERLKNINFKAKKFRKKSKALRKSIGSWNYRHWLSRLEMACEENCVRFTSINPAYTSQICNSCGQSDRMNRSKQNEFCCISCGHVDHADVNAAKNIMDRGVSLVYRRGK